MKYLDERITIQMDLGSPAPSVGIYKYIVYEYNDFSSQTDLNIFTGNFYYGGESRYYTFDITDIVRSRKFTFDKIYFTDTTTRTSLWAGLVNKYKITVFLSGSTTVTSSWNNVAMIYRYPNVKKGLTDGGDLFTNFESGTTNIVYPLIQGYKDTNVPPLLPHYPLVQTVNYKFCQTFITSNDVQEFQLWLRNSNFDDSTNLNVAREGNTTSYMITLNSIIDWQYYEEDLDEDVTVLKAIDDDYYNDIAVLDYCYKRYYLLWQDRYGGFQSQALNDYATYSETFETTETQNYKNERKKSFIQVQPKWKLNTGWIKEDVYPYYDSIYVSPILILYDTYEDKSYEVIVNADYTEKTYRSEKKMLNLTLDLEAISKQDIVY